MNNNVALKCFTEAQLDKLKQHQFKPDIFAANGVSSVVTNNKKDCKAINAIMDKFDLYAVKNKLTGYAIIHFSNSHKS